MALIDADDLDRDELAYRVFGVTRDKVPWRAAEIIGRGPARPDWDRAELAWRMASRGYYAEQAGLVAAVGLLEVWVPFESRSGVGSPLVSTVGVVWFAAHLALRRARPWVALGGLLVWPLLGVVRQTTLDNAATIDGERWTSWPCGEVGKMPRPERPLDGPDGPAARLAAELRQLREKAGSRSLDVRI